MTKENVEIQEEERNIEVVLDDEENGRKWMKIIMI